MQNQDFNQQGTEGTTPEGVENEVSESTEIDPEAESFGSDPPIIVQGGGINEPQA
jgi:hypothetical protein